MVDSHENMGMQSRSCVLDGDLRIDFADVHVKRGSRPFLRVHVNDLTKCVDIAEQEMECAEETPNGVLHCITLAWGTINVMASGR